MDYTRQIRRNLYEKYDYFVKRLREHQFSMQMQQNRMRTRKEAPKAKKTLNSSAIRDTRDLLSQSLGAKRILSRKEYKSI